MTGAEVEHHRGAAFRRGTGLRAVRLGDYDTSTQGAARAPSAELMVGTEFARRIVESVFEAIDPAKDVDGETMPSLAAMALGVPGFTSATADGIMRLLAAYGVAPEGKHAVVIERAGLD